MTTDTIRSRVPCAMRLDGPQNRYPLACSTTPTVGSNGLYRYCARHMQMVKDAGATTLVYDDRA